MAFLLIVHVPYEPGEEEGQTDEPNKLVSEIKKILTDAGVAEKDDESESVEEKADSQESGNFDLSSDDNNSSSSSSDEEELEEKGGKKRKGSRDVKTNKEVDGKEEMSDKQSAEPAENDDTPDTGNTEPKPKTEAENTLKKESDNIDKNPDKLDKTEVAKAIANLVLETAESKPLDQAADESDKEEDADTKGKGADTKERGADTKEKGADTKERGADTKEKGADTKEEGADTKEEKGADTKEKGADTKEKGDEDAEESAPEDGDVNKAGDSDGEEDDKENGFKHKLSNAELQELTPLLPELPLHKLVENTLIDFAVDHLDKTIIRDSSEAENSDEKDSESKTTVKFSFIQTDSMRCENIINKLKSFGVGGKVAGSSISVFPASVHECGEESLKSSPKREYTDEEILKEEGNFKKSIKSRLVVNQVVASVRSNAIFTFDYLLLLILASCISCLGLVENSSVVLVASMLISPLMGPILAVTFGQVIGNQELRNVGIKSELVGLLLCIVVGFVFGLVCGGIGLHGAAWGSTDSWPTYEMKSRGMLRSLWVGILIAMPSGAGVAISVLGGNAGSLVGVAISASLLPPACNAGMLWGYSLLAAISAPDVVHNLNIDSTSTTNSTITNTTTTTATSVPPTPTSVPESCLPLANNAYQQFYSCNVSQDAALLGLVSLLLTILNITCIVIAGFVILKIKEVARTFTDSTSSSMDHFWKEDVKVARNYYHTSKGQESKTLGKELLVEWQKFKDEVQMKKQKALEQLGELKEEEEEDGDDSESDEIKKQMQTIDMVNYISDIEHSPGIQHMLSRLSPGTPTEPVSACLSGIYNQATQELQNKLSQRPSVYLAEPKVRDKLVSNVYHTIQGPVSKKENTTRRPTMGELRGQLGRSGKSAYFNSVDLEMISEVDAGSGTRGLTLPSSGGLFNRRKKAQKQVKFQVTKVEEEGLLV